LFLNNFEKKSGKYIENIGGDEKIITFDLNIKRSENIDEIAKDK